MTQLQQVRSGLIRMMALISSEPVALPFTGLLLLAVVRCVPLARVYLTEVR